jgi:hypothetical protein
VGDPSLEYGGAPAYVGDPFLEYGGAHAFVSDPFLEDGGAHAFVSDLISLSNRSQLVTGRGKSFPFSLHL